MWLWSCFSLGYRDKEEQDGEADEQGERRGDDGAVGAV